MGSNLGSILINGKQYGTIRVNGSFAKRNYKTMFDNSYTRIQARSAADTNNNTLTIAAQTANSITEFHILNKGGKDIETTLPTTALSTYTLPDGNYEIIIKGEFKLGDSTEALGSTVFIDEVHLQPELTTGKCLFCNCTGITDLKTSLWDVSKMNTFESMFQGCSNLTMLDTYNWNTENVTNMTNMFNSCTLLKNVDISGFETTLVKNITGMFKGCSSLKALNPSSWNITGIKSLNNVFNGCSSLNYLNIDGWDTTNVTSMVSLFEGCSSLKLIKVDHFKTSNVTSMANLFKGCSLLQYFEISNWNISACIDFSSMLEGCAAIELLDLSKFIASTSAIKIENMFKDCSSLESLDISNFEVTALNGTANNVFDGCTSLTRVGWKFTDNQKLVLPTTVIEIFNMNYNCASTTSAPLMQNTHIQKITGGTVSLIGYPIVAFCTALTDFTNVEIKDTVTTLSCAFWGCTALTNIDTSKWDTSNVTYISGMFTQCSALTSIDMSNLDMRNVQDMQSTFTDCSNLETIILPKQFTGSNVTNAEGTFTSCPKLKTIKNIDKLIFTDGVIKTVSGMFMHCSALESLTLSNSMFNNCSCPLTQLFAECSSLKTISGMKNWDTSKITDFSDMFSNCSSLTELDLSNWTVKDSTVSMSSMFLGCSSLQSLDISNMLYTYNDKYLENVFKYCTSLTRIGWRFADNQKLVLPTTVTEIFNMNYTCSTSTPLAGNKVIQKITGGVINTNNTQKLLYQATNLTDFTGVEIKNTTSAYGMFAGCENLVNVDTTKWDFSNVTTIEYMFMNCYVLKSIIGIEKLNLNKVSIASQSFWQCRLLEEINLSKFTGEGMLPGVYTNSISYMFYGCNALKTINLSNLDTTNVIGSDPADGEIGMTGMFSGCKALTKIYGIENFNIKNLKSLNMMFQNCSSLVELDLSNWFNEKLVSANNMFQNCSSLTKLNFCTSSDKTIEIDIANNMFKGCSSLQSLDISNMLCSSTATVVDMNSVFDGCTSLTRVGWKFTDNQKLVLPTTVTEIFNINYNCSRTIPLAGNKVIQKITGGTIHQLRDSAFFQATSLTDFTNVEIKDTVTTLMGTFYGCTALTNVDTSKWDTSNVTDISGTFTNCSALVNIDMSSLTFSEGFTAISTFASCTSLKRVNINMTAKAKTTKGMFMGCTSLTSIDLSTWTGICANDADDDSEIISSILKMFYGCTAMEEIKLNSMTLVSNIKAENVVAFNGVPSTCVIYLPAEIANKYTPTQMGWSGSAFTTV